MRPGARVSHPPGGREPTDGPRAALVTFRVHEGGAPGVGTGSARIIVKPARKR